MIVKGLEFFDFDDIKPPIENPMWVMQECGQISIGVYHNNGMGCSGIAVCKPDLKNETILVSNNEFLVKVTHWSPLGDKKEIMRVLEIKED